MGHHPWRDTMHPGPIWNTNAGMPKGFQYSLGGGSPAAVVGTWSEVLAAGSVALTFHPTSFDMINHFPQGAGGPGRDSWFNLNHSVGETDEFLQFFEVLGDHSGINDLSAPFGAFDSFTVYRGIVANSTVSFDVIVSGRAGDTVSTEAHIAYTATPLTTTSPTWTTVNKFSGAVSPTGYVMLSPLMGMTGHHDSQAFMALARQEATGNIGIYTWDSQAGTSEVLENTIVSAASGSSGNSAAAVALNDNTFIVFAFFDFDTQEFVFVGKDMTTSTVTYETRVAHGAAPSVVAGIVLSSAEKNISAGDATQCNFSCITLGASGHLFFTAGTTGVLDSTDFSPSIALGGGDRTEDQYIADQAINIYKATSTSTSYVAQTPVSGAPSGITPLAASRSSDQAGGSAIQILMDDGSVYTYHPA
jgi:hypothetical protein